MDKNYYLYRIDSDANAKIFGRFPTLQMAKMSASLSLFKDLCFILSGDMTKIYFYYPDKKDWDYDLLTEEGRLDFLDTFPSPKDYK